MKAIHRIIILIILSIIIGLSAFFITDLASFPGRITTTEYVPTRLDGHWAFREGVAYRHRDMPPLLEIGGTPYEMGLQYGVLLRPEILAALEAYKKNLHQTAADMGLPVPVLVGILKFRSRKMAGRLPQRFLEEIRGVSRGSGVPEDAIIAVSLLYDVSMTSGCTGLLMRTREGAVIHGHTQEPYGFGYDGLLGKHTVVVRKKQEGYHVLTHIDMPLFMGVETGFNDKGLTYSEETYSIREPNPGGFPIVYLARMALEESATLEDVSQVLDKFSVAAPGGMIWSDRNERRGIRIEILPTGKSEQEFEGAILWDFNNIVDPKLAKQQHPRATIAGFNRDREQVAAAFPVQSAYTPEDAVAFLRSRHAPDGSDYSWLGARSAIANKWAQQMVVFDPGGNGFYLSLGRSFASLRTIYRFHDDFSKPPGSFLEPLPIEPVVEEAALISTGLMSSAERLRAYIGLTRSYPEDANTYFLAAYESFEQGRWDFYTHYAERAFQLAPDVAEYRLHAGLAAYRKGNLEKTIELLEGIGLSNISAVPANQPFAKNESTLSPELELYRLTALARAWVPDDPYRSKQYEAEKLAILEQYGAVSYYETVILPRFAGLERRP